MIDPRTVVYIVMALLVIAILVRAYHLDSTPRVVAGQESWLSPSEPQATLKSNCPEKGCIQFPDCPEVEDDCK